MAASGLAFGQAIYAMGLEVQRMVRLATENDNQAAEFLQKMQRVQDIVKDLKDIESQTISTSISRLKTAVDAFKDFISAYQSENAKAALKKGIFTKAKDKAAKALKADDVKQQLDKLDKSIEKAIHDLRFALEVHQANQQKKDLEQGGVTAQMIADMKAKLELAERQAEAERAERRAHEAQVRDMMLRMTASASGFSSMGSSVSSPTSAQVALCGTMAPGNIAAVGAVAPGYPGSYHGISPVYPSPAMQQLFPFTGSQISLAGYSNMPLPGAVSRHEQKGDDTPRFVPQQASYEMPKMPHEMPKVGVVRTSSPVSFPAGSNLSTTAFLQQSVMLPQQLRPQRDEKTAHTVLDPKVKDELQARAVSENRMPVPPSYAPKKILAPFKANGRMSFSWGNDIEADWTKPTSVWRQQLIDQGLPDPLGQGELVSTDYNTLFSKLRKSNMPENTPVYKNYRVVR